MVADHLATDLELFAGDNPGQEREWRAQAQRLRELAAEKAEFIQRLCADSRSRTIRPRSPKVPSARKPRLPGSAGTDSPA